MDMENGFLHMLALELKIIARELHVSTNKNCTCILQYPLLFLYDCRKREGHAHEPGQPLSIDDNPSASPTPSSSGSQEKLEQRAAALEKNVTKILDILIPLSPMPTSAFAPLPQEQATLPTYTSSLTYFPGQSVAPVSTNIFSPGPSVTPAPVYITTPTSTSSASVTVLSSSPNLTPSNQLDCLGAPGESGVWLDDDTLSSLLDDFSCTDSGVMSVGAETQVPSEAPQAIAVGDSSLSSPEIKEKVPKLGSPEKALTSIGTMLDHDKMRSIKETI